MQEHVSLGYGAWGKRVEVSTQVPQPLTERKEEKTKRPRQRGDLEQEGDLAKMISGSLLLAPQAEKRGGMRRPRR